MLKVTVNPNQPKYWCCVSIKNCNCSSTVERILGWNVPEYSFNQIDPFVFADVALQVWWTLWPVSTLSGLWRCSWNVPTLMVRNVNASTARRRGPATASECAASWFRTFTEVIDWCAIHNDWMMLWIGHTPVLRHTGLSLFLRKIWKPRTSRGSSKMVREKCKSGESERSVLWKLVFSQQLLMQLFWLFRESYSYKYNFFAMKFVFCFLCFEAENFLGNFSVWEVATVVTRCANKELLSVPCRWQWLIILFCTMYCSVL